MLRRGRGTSLLELLHVILQICIPSLARAPSGSFFLGSLLSSFFFKKKALKSQSKRRTHLVVVDDVVVVVVARLILALFFLSYILCSEV